MKQEIEFSVDDTKNVLDTSEFSVEVFPLVTIRHKFDVIRFWKLENCNIKDRWKAEVICTI
jgi:hypothetical protein